MCNACRFGESLDAAENVDASSDKIYLSPSFDQSLVSVTLISAEELLAWARLAQGNTNFEETENLLNTNSSPSNRAGVFLSYLWYLSFVFNNCIKCISVF